MIAEQMPGSELDKKLAEVTNYHSLTTAMNIDGTFGTVPEYSTSWSGMEQLAKSLDEEGFCFSIQKTEEGYEGHVYDGYTTSSIYCVFNAETAPHALSVAAIHALRAKKRKSVVK